MEKDNYCHTNLVIIKSNKQKRILKVQLIYSSTLKLLYFSIFVH